MTDTTTSTSATTGALKVVGGISTQENLNVGAVAKVISATDATSKTTGALIVTGGVGISKNIHGKNVFVEDVVSNSVTVTDTTISTSTSTGAAKVAGGLGVAGNVHCGNLTLTGNLVVTGNTTVINANNLVVQDPIIELGKGNTSGLDTGILMNNPLTSGNKGNVAVIYDFSTSNLEIGHTLKGATDSVIVMNTSNTLPVNINGTLGVTGSTTSSSKTTGTVQPLHQCIYGALFVLNCDLFDFGVGATLSGTNIYGTLAGANTAAVTTLTASGMVKGATISGTNVYGTLAGANTAAVTTLTASGMVKGATISGTNIYGTLAGANTAAVTTLTASGMVKGATISGTNVYGTLAGANTAAVTTLTASGMVKGATISGTNIYGTIAGANTAAVTDPDSLGYGKGC